ncbi:DNA-directed RNA polymerase subunit delta [Fictibacillus iocasae]|uniref:Probable DNA-directed RNA polymerase subunit delta n=1 Tax=Fictibacillus iocasae TaxID=2715437 RepID=A0ABW2NSD8_9BACL
MMTAYSKEEIMEMSMVEITYEILKEEKQPVQFNDLVKRIADLKEVPEKELHKRLAFFYTDLNIDGRYVSLGDNKWGLKAWYPFESSEEELGATNKPVKRKKMVDDEDFDDYDEDFEEDFDELDVDDEFTAEDDDDDAVDLDEDEDFDEEDEEELEDDEELADEEDLEDEE